MEAGPGTTGIVAGCKQSQAKFSVVQLQANGTLAATAYAHKSTDTRATDQQRIGSQSFTTKQRDIASCRLKGQLAREADKTEEIQLDVACGPGELTQGTIGVHHHGLPAAAGHDL